MLTCPKCKKTVNDNKSKFCSGCGELLNLGAVKKAGVSKGTVGGMFLVNCIPVLGFVAAFLWAKAKLKSAKFKLVSISVLFLIVNIGITLFVYTFTINQMKNTLAKAAANTMSIGSSYPNNPSSPFDENTNPGQVIPGMDFGMSGQPGTDYSGMEGWGDYNPDDSTVPNDYENSQNYIDSDGDGDYDTIIDEQGNEINLESMIKTDEDGNTYYDTNGDGIYEIMIDNEGVMHYDQDGDGEYETNYNMQY